MLLSVYLFILIYLKKMVWLDPTRLAWWHGINTAVMAQKVSGSINLKGLLNISCLALRLPLLVACNKKN